MVPAPQYVCREAFSRESGRSLGALVPITTHTRPALRHGGGPASRRDPPATRYLSPSPSRPCPCRGQARLCPRLVLSGYHGGCQAPGDMTVDERRTARCPARADFPCTCCSPGGRRQRPLEEAALWPPRGSSRCPASVQAGALAPVAGEPRARRRSWRSQAASLTQLPASVLGQGVPRGGVAVPRVVRMTAAGLSHLELPELPAGALVESQRLTPVPAQLGCHVQALVLQLVVESADAEVLQRVGPGRLPCWRPG